MFQSAQSSCILSHATSSPGTLVGYSEGLRVLGKGLCISMGFSAVSAIEYPAFGLKTFRKIHIKKWNKQLAGSRAVTRASLVDKPVLWIGRLCIFYALLKAGVAGSRADSLSDGGDDQMMSKWLQNLLPQGSETQQANDRRKMVSKWHATTKGTLKRSYRVPIKSEGRRLLKAIASLLSDDDTFRDATSHKAGCPSKHFYESHCSFRLGLLVFCRSLDCSLIYTFSFVQGCQIRRENAHGETVCCNNVRALFDELPTPHLVVEITAFPAGPLSESDYLKAEKIERVLRTGSSI
eukprot:Gb_00500 [translate_table: standard]